MVGLAVDTISVTCYSHGLEGAAVHIDVDCNESLRLMDHVHERIASFGMKKSRMYCM